MTKKLVQGIKNQHQLESLQNEEDRSARATITEEKKVREEEKVETVKSQLDPRRLKLFEAITEKGVNNWLNSMPLKEQFPSGQTDVLVYNQGGEKMEWEPFERGW